MFYFWTLGSLSIPGLASLLVFLFQSYISHFLNSSYHILDQLSSLLLEARSLRLAAHTSFLDQILGVCVGTSPAFVPSHLIPGPTLHFRKQCFHTLDQGSVLIVHCTKTALMRCDVQHNQKLSRYFEFLNP